MSRVIKISLRLKKSPVCPGHKMSAHQPTLHFLSPLYRAAAPHTPHTASASHHSLPFKILIWRVIRGGAPTSSAQTTAESTMIFPCRFDAGDREGRKKVHLITGSGISNVRTTPRHAAPLAPTCTCGQITGARSFPLPLSAVLVNSITVNLHLLPHCACHKTTAVCSCAPQVVLE